MRATTLLFFILALCTNPAQANSLRQDLAQKLIIDFRYFCQDSKKPCRTPMTELPKEAAKLLAKEGVGGVILFGENLQSLEQIINLNRALQQANAKSKAGVPLFLAIDQEGGRVARIPRQLTPAFSGNMAIGATYARHGMQFAEQTGHALAQQLKALGFNLNFAPTLDVNVNPDNPVINVRAFSADPVMVAELGLAQLKAMQQQGVMGAVKHFPGHGDTEVDSHTGLPRVDHDKATIERADLLPFQRLISAGEVKMLMTAHIQYPALDSSKIVNKRGESMLRPATLSKAILTDLLRDELGYQGLIVTDALDMAGVAHFFEPEQAVIETFKAGADIALMPLLLNSPKAMTRLSILLDALEAAVKSGELDARAIGASAKRIREAKTNMAFSDNLGTPVSQALAKANAALTDPALKTLEAQLADASLTLVKGQSAALAKKVKSLHLVLPDWGKCLALTQALAREMPALTTSCSSLRSFEESKAFAAIKKADALLLANINPAQSSSEWGPWDWDLSGAVVNEEERRHLLPRLLLQAQSEGKQSILVSLRAPYDIAQLGHRADVVLASYAYNTHELQSNSKTPQIQGPTFDALARALAGKSKPQGQLPVTLPPSL
ncbi:glycoside hydrolase family 3 N-terminal domain-containing protein [Aliiglaciecola sp. CAU 1673]|uniref:glycoside hydrolase family 3 N-terminal domain-containing protein n=1 Tax=Aliiglaciecola sp. CAU 1673 TaxID=3032595 RepID=UPI0023DB27D2|nr:glycoside hydrolase family 3 N-terminal domain-containing protein [Aliiglaciecola sp. CAU 1673]MDF2176672.1 glycoside hydrolase family 3 N-terminal domain-containing protein [Aliiglaciecola sp. CAU 1673]